MLTKFMKLQESMTGAIVGAKLATYNNSKVRAEKRLLILKLMQKVMRSGLNIQYRNK